MTDPMIPAEKRHSSRRTLKYLRDYFCGMWEVLKDHRGPLLWSATGLFFLFGILFPYDPAILASFQSGAGPTANELAWWLSKSGNFEYVPFLLPVGIWVVGLIRRKRSWIKAAQIILLAGIVAGISVNVLRPTYGRARPSSTFENGFYGPSPQHQFNSFPSGHATTAWATAVSTTMTMPVLGPPILAWAAGTAFSRMYQNSHYLSDITGGAALGSLIGWASVLGARRKRLL